MPRYVSTSDSETDFSEVDESLIGIPIRRKGTSRRRSTSRHRRTPTLSPPAPRDMHRPVSTGRGRRPVLHEPQAAVVVDIHNDTRHRSSSKSRRLPGSYVEADMPDEADIPVGEVLRSRHRIRRHHRASTSMSPSHSQSPHHRSYDLIMDQRILEKNDTRQDMELMRLQQEVGRLERELTHWREKSVSNGRRLCREDEERYEDEIRDRMRRLKQLERKQRAEEELRQVEIHDKAKRYDEEERLAAEREEIRNKLRQEKLRMMAREKEEQEERERIKQEIRDEDARKKAEEEERQKKIMKLKQEAIEEWKLQQEALEAERQREKQEKDREFRERLQCEFGYTGEEIERILAKQKDCEAKEEKSKAKERDPERTTWIKVHRRHLLPETLIAYHLPWDWDDRDTNYIIIKQWISEDLQDEIFAHTRRLREGKLVTQTSSSLTELKINDRKKDKLYLVRKRNPSRRSWIFT